MITFGGVKDLVKLALTADIKLNFFLEVNAAMYKERLKNV